MAQFTDYIKDTIAEMKHVSWPTQKQAIVYTALVVGVSVLVALFVALVDFGFKEGLDWFLGF